MVLRSAAVAATFSLATCAGVTSAGSVGVFVVDMGVCVAGFGVGAGVSVAGVGVAALASGFFDGRIAKNVSASCGVVTLR